MPAANTKYAAMAAAGDGADDVEVDDDMGVMIDEDAYEQFDRAFPTAFMKAITTDNVRILGEFVCLIMCTAATADAPKCVELLSQYGNIGVYVWGGLDQTVTPVMFAAIAGGVRALDCVYRLTSPEKRLGLVNSRDPYGNTPLHRAVQNPRGQACVVWLVDHGADINATNETEHTPLDIAVHWRHESIERYLVRAGAVRNGPPVNEPVDLEMHSRLVEFLTETVGLELIQILRADDVRLLAIYMHDVAVTAMYYGATRVARAIIPNDGPYVNEPSRRIRYLIIGAVSQEPEGRCRRVPAETRLTMVQQLLAMGASPNAVDRGGWTAAQMIIEEELPTGEKLQLLRLLAASGLDTGMLDPDGYSPLYSASAERNLPVFDYLLELGADMYKQQAHASLVHSLALVSRYKAIATLLDAGFDPNHRENEGVPVLLSVARTHNPTAVDMLLRAGADPNTSYTSPEDPGIPLTVLQRVVVMMASPVVRVQTALVLLMHGADASVVYTPSIGNREVRKLIEDWQNGIHPRQLERNAVVEAAAAATPAELTAMIASFVHM